MNPARAWLLLTTRSPDPIFTRGSFGSLKPSDVAHALGGLDRSRFLLGMAVFAGDRDNLHELVARVKLEVVLPAAEFGEWKIKRGSQAYRRLAALAVFETIHRDTTGKGVRCFVCNGKGLYTRPPELPTTVQARLAAQEHRETLIATVYRIRRLEWRVARAAEALRVRAQLGRKANATRSKRLKALIRGIEQLRQLVGIAAPAGCVTCESTGVIIMSGTHRAWLTGFEVGYWQRVWADRYDPFIPILGGWLSDCLTHVRERMEEAA